MSANDPETPIRDVRQIETADLAAGAFPEHATRADSGFSVVIKQSVLNEIYRHGKSVDRIEVCGVLVGNVYRDGDGPFLSIEASIRGDHASGASTSVTFTAETWTHIQETLELEHPGRRIVGWYHTHPGFGIFLSEMDTFICENFFPLAWQVAYVFDPVQHEEGCFAWKDGKPQRWPLTIAKDAPATHSVTSAAHVSDEGRGAGSQTDVAGLLERISVLERTQTWLVMGLVVLALCAIILPLVVYALSSGGAPAQPLENLPHLPTSSP